MKINQKLFINGKWTNKNKSEGFDKSACQIVLAFCGKEQLNLGNISAIKAIYSNAKVISATTAGEVLGDELYEGSIALTAIQFEKTEAKVLYANIKSFSGSYPLGKKLAALMPPKGLQYILVISDGNLVNGTELVAGISSSNKNGALITGGMAGDGARFVSTLVGVDENISEGNVALIGLYGDNIKIGHGSLGGWDEFGLERTITKSEKNVLHEMDGKNALELYKEYLGPYVDELPSSALLFPLSIKKTDSKESNVRTIVSIDEEKQSMTFAGNMPEGSKVRLMKANFDKLISAAGTAADRSLINLERKPDLALLISCVGRKIILNERVEEELEQAKAILGTEVFITGFYSYGEISPIVERARCELLNQTMTITTFTEF
ncbi:MAG: hypothetical protein ACI9DJ_003438 [Algoriphagus sp.]|jgi:hypothetical protein